MAWDDGGFDDKPIEGRAGGLIIDSQSNACSRRSAITMQRFCRPFRAGTRSLEPRADALGYSLSASSRLRRQMRMQPWYDLHQYFSAVVNFQCYG